LFPTSKFFNTLFTSFTTLFALLVGDSLLNIHKDIAVHAFLSLIYMSI
jgi:hypothetical protein